MSPIGPLPPTVADDEILARFIDHRSDVRADQTLRPDPFIPYPYPELSVTRHKNLTSAEIWQFARISSLRMALHFMAGLTCPPAVFGTGI